MYFLFCRVPPTCLSMLFFPSSLKFECLGLVLTCVILMGWVNPAQGVEQSASPSVSFAFVAQPGNPLTSLRLGRNLSPVAGDLNGDGQIELYVGAYGERMEMYSQEDHAFSHLSAIPNPLDSVTMSYERDTPCVALADMDNDGDADAVWFDFRPVATDVSEIYLNGIVFLKNVGTSSVPEFQMVEGKANPFAGISSEWQGTPVFGDFDRDGDADLLFGDRSGQFRYCRNLLVEEGHLVYAEMMGRLNPFAGIDVGGNSSPAVIDIDGDGDLDVISGEIRGRLRWIENVTPSGGAPRFVLKKLSSGPFASFNAGIASMPTVLDVDGDTDMDVVVGNGDGHFTILANQQYQSKRVTSDGFPIVSVERAGNVDGDLNGDAVVDVQDGYVALKALAGALMGVLNPGLDDGAKVSL